MSKHSIPIHHTPDFKLTEELTGSLRAMAVCIKNASLALAVVVVVVSAGCHDYSQLVVINIGLLLGTRWMVWWLTELRMWCDTGCWMDMIDLIFFSSVTRSMTSVWIWCYFWFDLSHSFDCSFNVLLSSHMHPTRCQCIRSPIQALIHSLYWFVLFSLRTLSSSFYLLLSAWRQCAEGSVW